MTNEERKALEDEFARLCDTPAVMTALSWGLSQPVGPVPEIGDRKVNGIVTRGSLDDSPVTALCVENVGLVVAWREGVHVAPLAPATSVRGGRQMAYLTEYVTADGEYGKHFDLFDLTNRVKE